MIGVFAAGVARAALACARRPKWAALRLAVFVLLTAAPASAEPVTYSKDVAPLLADRCVMCHHAGGSAPFSLVTYDEVRRRATLITKVTKSRYMPPWKADPSDGPFVGQHPLSGGEIQLLQRWVDGGTLAGDAHAQAPAQTWTEGWQLGKPDLVLSLTPPYTLPPEGTDAFRIFVLPIPIETARFVRGLEFRPGNPKVVHHANIRIDKTRASRALDDRDPGPGYDGVILRSADYPDGHFLGWTPGQISPLLPKALAWRLEKNTDLVVEIHMQPSGKPEEVNPSIGLYFSDEPPTRTPAMLRLGRQNIDIPAGNKHYTVEDSYVLPVDVDVEALQPHAHYRARDVRGEATLPDGSTLPLIHIKDWDFRWQHVYRYVTPPHLPKGTTVSMRYIYDNSSENPRNPEQPPVRARWGQRSSDEMGDLWLQVLTRNERDLDVLSADFRPKVLAEDVLGYESEIEKHPDEDALHDSVAMLYLELGKADGAIRHFGATVRLKPQSAQSHYNLATALTIGHRLDDATAEFAAAIRIDPDYAKAHNNLGNVFLAQGKVAEALREFRAVVRLQPEAADGLANLAWLLAASPPGGSEGAEAVALAEHLRDLTGGKDVRALDVLAAAYASAGQFDRAVETADAALKLGPADPLAGEIRRHREMYRRHERLHLVMPRSKG